MYWVFIKPRRRPQRRTSSSSSQSRRRKKRFEEGEEEGRRRTSDLGQAALDLVVDGEVDGPGREVADDGRAEPTVQASKAVVEPDVLGDACEAARSGSRLWSRSKARARGGGRQHGQLLTVVRAGVMRRKERGRERGDEGKWKGTRAPSMQRGSGLGRERERDAPRTPLAPPLAPPAWSLVLTTSSGQVTMLDTRPAPAPASMDSAPRYHTAPLNLSPLGSRSTMVIRMASSWARRGAGARARARATEVEEEGEPGGRRRGAGGRGEREGARAGGAARWGDWVAVSRV